MHLDGLDGSTLRLWAVGERALPAMAPACNEYLGSFDVMFYFLKCGCDSNMQLRGGEA